MAKTYKWKADTTYKSDTTLSYGVIPTSHTGWQTAQAGTQTARQWTYWYRDSNTPSSPGVWTDANSSRVKVTLTESWTATIDNRNYLTITINTTIDSVDRDDLRGVNQDTPGREISIYRVEGGPSILSITDLQLAHARNLYQGPLVLDSYTFTLAPGESLQRSSLYLHNQAIGWSSYDDIWFGVLFMNDLPAETIPHAVRGSNNKWLSHNRTNGDLRIRTSTQWSENLPNVDGGVGYGDPPSVYKESKWLNARTFGEGA